MKKCPFCAEDIQDAAIVCKHCGRNLPTETPNIAVTPTARPPKSGQRKWVALGIVTVLAGLALTALLTQRSPSRPTSKRRVECAAPPGETLTYEAEFIPGRASSPVDSLTVTFRGTKPTSSFAETVLRRCLQAAPTTVRIDYEVLATTWFNDDGPLPLIDGSHALAYNPKTGKVQTSNEREGVKPTQAKRDGYTVEYQEKKRAVPPHGKFATIDVLFEKPPSEEAEILKILTTEIIAAVSKQSPKLDTTAYAQSGSPTDRAAQKQIRGASGQYLSVEFDPKSGRVRDQDGRVRQTIR